MFNVSINQLPFINLTASGAPKANQPLAVENVEAILRVAGITIRMNMMLNRFEFTGQGVGAGEHAQQAVFIELEDTLTILGVGGLARLPDILALLANRDPYHPMEDWLLSKKWDGVDRLADLAATVPTDSVVWPEYLRKWLIQSVEAVRGWRAEQERSIPHVLVFVGGQGAGKGRWLRHLTPGFVLADAELHLSSYGSKDQQLEALRWPQVELGEIDSTLKKSEISALKSFLSRPVDSLRAPYARLAVRRPRMTVFSGSVNNVQFLNDPSGARRFWPVGITGELEWDHGLDVQQLYAQINTYWEAMEDWNLEDETEEARRQELQRYVQQSAAVDLVSAHYADHCKEFTHYAYLNKTEICKTIGIGTHPVDTGNVVEWLISHLGDARHLGGRYRVWAFPVGVAHVANLPSAKTGFLDETDAKARFMSYRPLT